MFYNKILRLSTVDKIHPKAASQRYFSVAAFFETVDISHSFCTKFCTHRAYRKKVKVFGTIGVPFFAPPPKKNQCNTGIK